MSEKLESIEQTIEQFSKDDNLPAQLVKWYKLGVEHGSNRENWMIPAEEAKILHEAIGELNWALTELNKNRTPEDYCDFQTVWDAGQILLNHTK